MKKDGRLLITDSDSDDGDGKKKKKGKWKNLSDDDEDDERSESDLSFDDGDDRDVDDILSQYSKHSKMTQLKKALADVARSGRSKSQNRRLSPFNQKDVIANRRRILDAVKNDSWTPGELQPYRYHQISPGLLSRKKRHLKKSVFQKVMGKRRDVTVRTDNFETNYLKISRTRKVGHGRYTLKRSKIKAKQKHLMQDIFNKHRQNKLRRMQRSKSKKRSKSQKRGKKRKISEV